MLQNTSATAAFNGWRSASFPPDQSHTVLAQPWNAEKRLFEGLTQIRTMLPLATRSDCLDLSCQTQSPGLHLSLGSISASVRQDATSLSCAGGNRPADGSLPTTMSQSGPRSEHVTELSGDHGESS